MPAPARCGHSWTRPARPSSVTPASSSRSISRRPARSSGCPNGTHYVQYSPDKRFLIDTWSRVNQPPINELRRTEDGKLLCRLEEADMSELLASGWTTPEPFVAKGRDGKINIYGMIWRPKNFDP